MSDEALPPATALRCLPRGSPREVAALAEALAAADEPGAALEVCSGCGHSLAPDAGACAACGLAFPGDE